MVKGIKTFTEMFFILMIFLNDMTSGGAQGPLRGYNSLSDATIPSFMTPEWVEPYFDAAVPKNVTVLVGKSAYLSCRVRNLGNKAVAWIRHRDFHILTVGTYTYTTDQRFQTTFHRDLDEWTLQIKWAQKRDSGIYECQILTQPVRTFSVELHVVVPSATIIGGPDLYVDKGSTINLTCAIKFSPEPPTHIFWYHQDKVIGDDNLRSQISFSAAEAEGACSILRIYDADITDSGKYSCFPSNTDKAIIRVHVLNGERPEAMQTSGSSSNIRRWTSYPFCDMINHHIYYQILAISVILICYNDRSRIHRNLNDTENLISNVHVIR